MSTPPPLEGVVPSLRPSAVIHTDLDSRAELAQLRLQTDWSSGWAAAPKRLARAHAREGLSNEEVRSFDEDAVPSNSDTPVYDEVVYDRYGFVVKTGDSGTRHGTLELEAEAEAISFERWNEYLLGQCGQNIDDDDFDWDLVDVFDRTPELQEMVHDGVPHAIRARVWERLLGANLRRRGSQLTYAAVCRHCMTPDNDTSESAREIEKDILRTLPQNLFFSSPDAPGIARLRRVLRACCWMHPDTGYCQGMGVIVCSFLLLMEEEETFWCVTSLMHSFMPMSYYSMVLLGAQADQQVLSELLTTKLPELDAHLAEMQVELPLVSLNWFITAFSSVLVYPVLMRAWDCLFFHGPDFLFRLALSLCRMLQGELMEQTEAAGVFAVLGSVGAAQGTRERAMVNANELIALAVEFVLNEREILSQRDEFRAQLLQDMNATQTKLRAPPVSARQRRQQRMSSVSSVASLGSYYGSAVSGSWLGRAVGSMYGTLFAGEQKALDGMRKKNIEQSQRMVELKEAIVALIQHFKTFQPCEGHARARSLSSSSSSAGLVEGSSAPFTNTNNGNGSVSLVATPMTEEFDPGFYSNPFTADDVGVSGKRPRRAKVVHAYTAASADELTLRRGDVITLLRWEDEHCWEGLIDGQRRGWFPSRFARLLDERVRDYDAAGDDAVDSAVVELVRGRLCRALARVFAHGFKKESVTSVYHVWDFISECARASVAPALPQTQVHLELTSAFSLATEQLPLPSSSSSSGAVRGRHSALSPSELLYQAVCDINASHSMDALPHKDARFRSLVCVALNHQMLHLWWQILCRAHAVLSKWYTPWSYLRSPVWIQIRCDLKLLSRLTFDLNRDYEVDFARQSDPIRESVRSMLVQHHLFSWEL